MSKEIISLERHPDTAYICPKCKTKIKGDMYTISLKKKEGSLYAISRCLICLKEKLLSM